MGSSKPNRKIFELALSKAVVKPEHTLYVGDNYYDDYMRASCAGLEFVLINHIGREGIEETGNVDVLSDVREISECLSQSYGI